MGEVRACLLMNRFAMLLLNTLIVVFFTTSTTACFHGITPRVYYYILKLLYFLVTPNGPLPVLSHQMLF